MLTVLVGPNTAARAKRLEALLASLRAEGTDIREWSDVNFSPDDLRAIAGSQSLFSPRMAAVVSGAESPLVRDELETLIAELSNSDAQFIILAATLPAAFLKKAAAAKAAVETFSEKTTIKKAETFNVFSLTDAFCDRKRTIAWALYRKALRSGLEPRELHGKLFWATKTMLVADASSSAKESGQHPFVYQKSKKAAENFAPGELRTIAYDLGILFHDATFSGKDMELELEGFILRALEKKKTV